MRKIDRQVFDVCYNYASEVISGIVSPCILCKYSEKGSVIEIYRHGEPKTFDSSLVGRVSIVGGETVNIDSEKSSLPFKTYFVSQMEKRRIPVAEKDILAIE
jgi:hypothetical protein